MKDLLISREESFGNPKRMAMQPTVWTQDLGVKWDLHASTSSKARLVWSL